MISMIITRFLLLVLSVIAVNAGWAKDNKKEVREIRCLAQNIYFEARGEPENGQFAVAAVTMNRVASDKYPNTVCKVVWQRHQFSWTHDGKSDRPRDKNAWRKAKQIARLVYERYFEFQDRTNGAWDLTRGALHYFAPHLVFPDWAKSADSVTYIGRHAFVAYNS